MIIKLKFLTVILSMFLFLIGGVGYTESEIPHDFKYSLSTRNMNTENQVIFNHSKHAMEYKITCVDCHHQLEPGAEAVGENCLDCHGSKAIRSAQHTVIAMTNKSKGARGASAFIVEKGTPGFEAGKKENKMGIRGSATRELVFQDCRIPAENLIAREGMGFIVAMKTLDMSRPGVAAQALGIAQGAMDEVLQYTRERRQFKKPISSFQGVQFMMADMATKIEAGRCLVYQSARHIDSGAKNVSKISAMAKVFCSDMAMEVTTDAVQLLGGYGYMKEYPVEKMMRDAKITQIYEGTNQIQREVIALNLIKEAAAAKKK